MKINVSVIIPAFNESENLISLIDKILKQKYLFDNMEIILVDDFSNDNTHKVIEKYKNKGDIIYLQNLTRSGQSMSISNGIKKSKYENIITLDGDGQNDPDDFSLLLNNYKSNKYYLISGIRKIRKDNFVKKISSKIANYVRSLILNDKCEDSACGLKIFSKAIFLKIKFFDGMHRFLPALFIAYGVKPVYVSINHKSRLKGKSKYGILDRLFRGIFDLYKVKKMINEIKSKKC